MPYARNGRVRIYWEEEGRGDSLLLIMGLSFSLAMWEELRPFFAQHFRTVLFDNRCVGKSDSPLLPFSIADMAADAAAVLDVADVRSAHVFGISMGGMIAQELSTRHPERVNRLILGCTHCAGTQAVLARTKTLLSLASPYLSRKAKLRAIVPVLYAADTPPDRIERDLSLIRRNPVKVSGYLQQLAAIGRWRLTGKPASIQATTLVLHGGSDRLVPSENGRILADMIPGAKLVLLPGAGHIFPTDQPELTRAALRSFLKM